MVKNTKGGNKGKKMGRKYAVDSSTHKTRFSEDSDEVYACCQKLLGNGMFNALCSDKKERICIIRKKFKGRGKRDNIINIGTWVLVGLRSFEARAQGKLEKCDLLEVYSDSDRQKLKQQQTHIEWNIFESIGNLGQSESNNNNFDFMDGGDITESDEEENNTTEITNFKVQEEIDLDDI